MIFVVEQLGDQAPVKMLRGKLRRKAQAEPLSGRERTSFVRLLRRMKTTAPNGRMLSIHVLLGLLSIAARGEVATKKPTGEKAGRPAKDATRNLLLQVEDAVSVTKASHVPKTIALLLWLWGIDTARGFWNAAGPPLGIGATAYLSRLSKSIEKKMRRN